MTTSASCFLLSALENQPMLLENRFTKSKKGEKFEAVPVANIVPTVGFRARIFKRLRSPAIDSEEIPPAYVAGTTNRVEGLSY